MVRNQNLPGQRIIISNEIRTTSALADSWADLHLISFLFVSVQQSGLKNIY